MSDEAKRSKLRWYALSPITHHPSPITGLALACAALALVFWGLLQLDLPLARYLRSVHQPWLEQVGDVGNRLGSGAVLVAISGSLLLAGWARDRPVLRRAGIDGLLAHAGAALVVNVLKHLIGRPRPRLTHADGLLAGPSLASGFDSFPSGHVAASFAVAAVMARHFPRLGWLVYGLAGLVVFSRVVRGSHFPTDVLAGAALGLIAGYLAVNPLRAWLASAARALLALAPYAAGAFVLLWIASHPSPDGHAAPAESLVTAAGALTLAIGWVARLACVVRGLHPPHRWTAPLIGAGLAATSGSALVALAALLAGAAGLAAAAWVAGGAAPEPGPPAEAGWKVVARETALAAGLAAGVALLHAAQGLLPIL